MKIEDQVCSLELSKKLKEIYVNQDSYFCWYSNENPICGIFREDDVVNWNLGEYKIADEGGADWIYSAFTAAELGDLLPQTLNIEIDQINTISVLSIFKLNYKWTCAYYYNFIRPQTLSYTSGNLVDCLASMLIYLIENNLIDLKGD